MKKFVILCFLALTPFSCKAQIVPVEQVLNNFDNVPDENAYIKDVNHIFDDYIGTWKGNIDNIEYTFVISKNTIVFDGQYNIDADILVMKHLIFNTRTFEVVENTLDLPDQNAPCKGIFFRTTSQTDLTYVFRYIGEEYFCGQNGDVFITLVNNNSQMQLFLYPNHEIYNDCQTGLVNQVLPTEKIVLTKQ